MYKTIKPSKRAVLIYQGYENVKFNKGIAFMNIPELQKSFKIRYGIEMKVKNYLDLLRRVENIFEGGKKCKSPFIYNYSFRNYKNFLINGWFPNDYVYLKNGRTYHYAVPN